MRHLIWIAVAMGFAMPIAYAQSSTGTKAGTYDASPAGGSTPPAYRADQLSPGNCGTPDDPKPCGGPLPRHALKHYRVKPATG
jgi:hypothetical protein